MTLLWSVGVPSFNVSIQFIEKRRGTYCEKSPVRQPAEAWCVHVRGAVDAVVEGRSNRSHRSLLPPHEATGTW